MTFSKITLARIVFAFAFFFVASTSYSHAQGSLEACFPPTPPTAPKCGETCTPGGAKCPLNCGDCAPTNSGYKCTAPAACGVKCDDKAPGFCTGARDGCTACISGVCARPSATPTPTTAPACNTSCNPSIPSSCAGARDGCTTCSAAGKCVAPPTATPTKSPPACNSDCSTPADCTGARDGCTTCSAGGKCVAPPTATPTIAPPACGNACDTKDPTACAGARDGCTACINGVCAEQPACGASCDSKDPTSCAGARDGCTVCTPGGVCAAPTATPTPTPDPFNEDMCKCDGLEHSAILQNQSITVTAYGKVLAADDLYAKISTIDFTLFKSTGGTQVQSLISTDPPLAAQKVASVEPGTVRYAASWTFDMPKPVESGVEYRVITNAKCSRQTAAPPTQSVQAVEDTNVGFFDRIINFFAGLFGGNNNATQNIASDDTASPTKANNGDQLKLGNFVPMNSTVTGNDNCTTLKFKYDPI